MSLTNIVKRSSRCIFACRDDVRITAKALIELSFGTSLHAKFVSPLKKYGRKDPALMNGVYKDVLSTCEGKHCGMCIALMVHTLPREKTTAQAWSLAENCVFTCLGMNEWDVDDVKTAMLYWCSCENVSQSKDEVRRVLNRFIDARLDNCAASDLLQYAFLVDMLVTLNSTDCVRRLAARTAQVIHVTPHPVAGFICWLFNKINFSNDTFALAVQQTADSIAEKGDLFTVIHTFKFATRQNEDVISANALQWLAERLVGEVMDLPSIALLLSSLAALPERTCATLLNDIRELLTPLCEQLCPLLAALESDTIPDTDDAVTESVAHDRTMVYQLLEHILLIDVKHAAVFGEETFRAAFDKNSSSSADSNSTVVPDDSDVDTMVKLKRVYRNVLDTIVRLAHAHIEHVAKLSSSAIHTLLLLLLKRKETNGRSLGIEMLHECMNTHKMFTFDQTFSILALLGDSAIEKAFHVDTGLVLYLSNEFAKFMDCVTEVHLVAALKAVDMMLTSTARVHDEQTALTYNELADHKLDNDQMQLILRCFAERTYELMRCKLSLRCALTITAILHKLKYKDAKFFKLSSQYMTIKSTYACPMNYCKNTVQLARLAIADTYDSDTRSSSDNIRSETQYDALHHFYDAVDRESNTCDTRISPSEWVYVLNSKNTKLPLSPQEMQVREQLDRMRSTPDSKREVLVQIASSILHLQSHDIIADYVDLIHICGLKLLKEDKLIKQCLERMMTMKSMTSLTDEDVAAVLHSLSEVKFIFSTTVKNFLIKLTKAQWNDMNVVPLTRILGALGKLSIRTPVILNSVYEQLDKHVLFLSPKNIANILQSLNNLGCINDHLVKKIVDRAASMASSLDEVSLSTLFTMPSFYRYLKDNQAATPLTLQAAIKIQSPRTRERIAHHLRRSTLTRALVSSTLKLLENKSQPGKPKGVLQLE